MPVTIIIPTPLRHYADDRAEMEVEAQTVGQAIDHLTIQYTQLRRHLYNEQDRLRNFVNVYLNDEDVRLGSGLNAKVGAKDEISIVPAVAGGRCRA